MAEITYFRPRLTHKYISQYDHLDEWGDPMRFKILGRKFVEEGNGYDYLGAYRMRVIGSKKLDQDLQAQAIAQNMGYSGCTHEYDCCGCHSVSARVKKVRRGVFSVLISTSRNY